MNKPIRYGLAEEHLGRIYRQEDGHLVMWADYAALAAENERLKDHVEFLERAERFQIYDHDTKTWVVRFSEPK